MAKKKLLVIYPEKSQDQQSFYDQWSSQACRNISEIEKFLFKTRWWTRTIIHWICFNVTNCTEWKWLHWKSFVASYVEPPKEAELGSFESEKDTSFSVDWSTKTNNQTKKKRKWQKTRAEKIKLQRKKLLKVKTCWCFLLLVMWGNLMTRKSRYEHKKTVYLI